MGMMRWSGLAFVLLVGACADEAAWQVGAAKVAITPDRPVWLAGYSRDSKSDGVHDDIWARAMAIDNGSATVLILAVDLIGLMRPDVNDIRRDLTTEQLPFDHIIVASTHNHSGPDVIGLWHVDRGKSGVDFAYLDTVKARMVRVGKAALADLKPAALLVSRNEVLGISYNARDEGVLDVEAVSLRAQGEDGRTIGTLVNFACHPEVLTKQNRRLTSDFAHYTYGRLEERLGGVALYVNGALGGMVTPLVTAHSFREAARCGHALADSVLSGVKREKLIRDGRLMSVREDISLAMDNPAFRALAEAGVIHRAFEDSIDTEVGALRIGPVLVATVPGEALPVIGFTLKGAMVSDYRMVFGLANDELGYLIPSVDWREDEYEETMSLGKTAGDVVTAETLRLIGEL